MDLDDDFGIRTLKSLFEHAAEILFRGERTGNGGVAGALVGGFIGSAMGFGDVNGINGGSILLATLGAILLLAIYRLTRRRVA